MLKKDFAFLDDDVNCQAVIDFMDKCKEKKTDVHSFEVVKNGKLKIKIAPPPYSFEYKQQVYSLSKSFASTAIGFLCDDKKLNIDDKLIDIFPDKTPEKVGKNLNEMRLVHLLSMNTGHAECLLGSIRNEKDPVRKFMSYEPEYEPGTHFCYNNAATFVLSEIVRKYAGMSLFDFLSLRLFEPLNIQNTHWDTFADGNSQGAVGLHISTDDAAKLGKLYLNNGIYNGKRILSESWVKSAQSPWSDNSPSGVGSWGAGYGFQFWLNENDGFRADGSFGQLCVIMPSKDMVFAMQAFSEDIHGQLKLIFDFADEMLGESDVAEDAFCDFLKNYNAVTEYRDTNNAAFDKVYLCEENGFGITLVKITDKEDAVQFDFSDGSQWQTIKFGKGRFCNNRVFIKKLKPTIETLAGCDDKLHTHFAAYCYRKGGNLYLHMNFLDNPYVEEYICTLRDGEIFIQKDNPDQYSYNGSITGNFFEV